jgi:di/tricarboxylate transporter
MLEAGERVVLRSQVSELLSLQRDKSLSRVDQLSAVETTTVEVLITPGCKMVGRNLGGLRLRRRFGVYPLAVHRRNQNIGQNLDALIVRIGDTLLLEGNPADIHRLSVEMDLVDDSRPSSRTFRRSHRPIAIVAFAALGVAPLFLLSLCAVALFLITRCIDADEAFSLSKNLV